MLISGPDVGLTCLKLLPAPPAVFKSVVLLTSGLRVGGASVLSGSRESLTCHPKGGVSSLLA